MEVSGENVAEAAGSRACQRERPWPEQVKEVLKLLMGALDEAWKVADRDLDG